MSNRRRRSRAFLTSGNTAGQGKDFNEDFIVNSNNDLNDTAGPTDRHHEKMDQQDFLSIVVSNCRGYKSKRSSIVEAAYELKPDILCLQETLLAGKAKPSLQNYVSFNRNREVNSGGGVSTLVSNRISNSTTATATGTDDTEFVSVRIGHMEPGITVINWYACQETRRDLVDESWDTILGQLAAATARGDRCILTGDFNRRLGKRVGDSKEVSYGGKKVLELIDTGEFALVNEMNNLVRGGPYTRADPADPSKKSVLSYFIVSSALVPNIDFLLIDSDRRFTPKRVLRRGNGFKTTYSDHYMMELRLKNIPKIPKKVRERDWFFKKFNGWKRFRELTEEKAGEFKKLVDKIDDVNVLDKKLRKLEEKILWTVFGKRTRKITGGKFSEGGRSTIADENVSAGNRATFEMEMEKLQLKDSRLGKIWELRGLLHGKKKTQQQPPSAVVDPKTGKLVCTVEEIKSATRQHVQNTLKDATPIEKFKHVILDRELKHFRFMSENKELRMNLPKPVFDLVLERMRRVNKPCYRLATKAAEAYTDAMYDFFVKIVEKEEIPKSFAETSLTQLHKKGPTSDLGNWRFIHMKGSTPRLFEASLTEMMKDNLTSGVSPYQLGGIAGNRPAQHLYTVKTALASREAQRLPSYVSLFDMRKFFDVESAIDVCMTMHDVGCRGPMYRMFFKMCQFNRLTVKTPVGNTDPFDVGAIIPQGSSYGAITSSVNLDRAIFKVFSDLLGLTVNECGVPMRPLCFQDDILKVSGCKSEAQISQSTIFDAISEKTLEFNLSKCKVVIHGTSILSKMERACYQTNPITTGPAAAPLSASEKYLGDMIHERDLNQSWLATIKDREGKVKGAIAETLAVVEDLKATNLGPLEIGLQLWNKVIIPCLLYNSETWIKMKEKDMKRLEDIQFNFLRRLTKSPRHILRAGLLWESGQWPMSMRVMYNKFLFRHHLEMLPASSVAKQMWEGEPLVLKGLRYETALFGGINNIRLPLPSDDKWEYKKYLKNEMEAIREKEMTRRLEASKSMDHLSYETASTKDYWKTFTLEKARFLFSCRTGCNSFFAANDWNSKAGKNCYCGSTKETSKHLLFDCPLYAVCRDNHPARHHDNEDAVNFWGEVLDQKAKLAAAMPPPNAAPESDDESPSLLSKSASSG